MRKARLGYGNALAYIDLSIKARRPCAPRAAPAAPRTAPPLGLLRPRRKDEAPSRPPRPAPSLSEAAAASERALQSANKKRASLPQEVLTQQRVHRGRIELVPVRQPIAREVRRDEVPHGRIDIHRGRVQRVAVQEAQVARLRGQQPLVRQRVHLDLGVQVRHAAQVGARHAGAHHTCDEITPAMSRQGHAVTICKRTLGAARIPRSCPAGKRGR